MGFTMGFSSSLGIYMIREIMKGIRIVKCYAWEAAMEVAKRVADFENLIALHQRLQGTVGG